MNWLALVATNILLNRHLILLQLTAMAIPAPAIPAMSNWIKNFLNLDQDKAESSFTPVWSLRWFPRIFDEEDEQGSDV